MIYVRSFLFNVIFFIMMTFVSLSALIAGYIKGYKGINAVGVVTSRCVEFLMKYIVGATTEFRGQENVPEDNQYVVACKHQSAWETVSLHRFVPDPTVIMKADLGKIPMFGSVVRNAESILVERKKGSQVGQIIEGSKRSLKDNRPVFIFPEGTRSRAGEAGKYRSGVFRIYDELQVPVLPIALNSGYFWPRRGFLKYPGHIVVSILPPIQPGLSEAEFMKTLEDAIETECVKIAPPITDSNPFSSSKSETRHDP